MNLKRILLWGGFIAVVALIIWGLIAAEKKSNKELSTISSPDEITSIDHVKGNTNATVTLLEYGDFQCPGCAQFYPIVESLLQEFGSTSLRFVYRRHFPLSGHPNAIPAALASEAAHDQGKFFEMYALLYSRQKDWDRSDKADEIFEKYALELGLDIEKYKISRDLPETLERINNDYKGGVKAKISGTPTFFVNGKVIVNPRNYEEFKNIIEQAIRDGETS